MANCCFRKGETGKGGWKGNKKEMLGGSEGNNPDRIMMVWSSGLVVYKS